MITSSRSYMVIGKRIETGYVGMIPLILKSIFYTKSTLHKKRRSGGSSRKASECLINRGDETPI